MDKVASIRIEKNVISVSLNMLLMPDGLAQVFQKLMIYRDFPGFTENSPKRKE